MDIIQNHLEAIPGIHIYPIISFILFFIVFIVVLIHTFSIDKKTISEMKNIPLDEEEQDNQ
jgi:cbb3-type cytochrome oxidase subunit 3